MLLDRGIDMRAEVGLLTRNVKIHSELQNQCYNYTTTNNITVCNFFSRDMFGGHIITHQGFGTFKVENAEITKMGQQGIMARFF